MFPIVCPQLLPQANSNSLSKALSLSYSFNEKEMRYTKQTKVGREEHNVPYTVSSTANPSSTKSLPNLEFSP
jgi:hypothetical protein